MEQIIPISIWPAGLINCFLIKGKKGHILVDTGVPKSQKRIFKQLEANGIDKNDIKLLIVSHCHIDHFGSAAKLKEILNVPVLVHQLDVPYYREGKANLSTLKPNKKVWVLFKWAIQNMETLPFEPDIILKQDEVYDLNKWGVKGKVIHTPGHTPGSLSVLLDNGQGILVDMLATGILLGGVILNSRVKHPPFHDSMPDLKKSFDKVLAEKTETFYISHGKPVKRKHLIKYYRKYLEKC